MLRSYLAPQGLNKLAIFIEKLVNVASRRHRASSFGPRVHFNLLPTPSRCPIFRHCCWRFFGLSSHKTVLIPCHFKVKMLQLIHKKMQDWLPPATYSLERSGLPQIFGDLIGNDIRSLPFRLKSIRINVSIPD